MNASSRGISEWRHGHFLISTDRKLLQIERIQRFLSSEAYWCLDIPTDVVAQAAENSFCFGLYDLSSAPPAQIGYARIITDYATFGWLADVYVEQEFRGQGLSKWLMECIMGHPLLKNLRRICLATKDAHSLYSKYGFEVTKTPGYWMEIKDNDIYKKLKFRLQEDHQTS